MDYKTGIFKAAPRCIDLSAKRQAPGARRRPPQAESLAASAQYRPPATRSSHPEPRNPRPAPRNLISEDRYSGFKSSYSTRHALCALPYAHNYQPQFLTFPASHLPSFLACPATRTPRLATRNPQLASRTPHPASRSSQPATRNPQPATRNPQPATHNPQRATRIPQPVSGFTLMEILLAFMILAIVVSTILGSFDAVFSTTDTLENSSKYYDMAKNCLHRMSLDLDSLYVTQPPFYKKPEFDDPPDPYRLVGSNVDVGGTGFASLRFTSKAHVPLDNSSRGGIAEIVYYVQAKTDGQMVLRRADHLFPYPPFEEKGDDPVLCQYVKSLAFKYYDADGEESEAWDSDTDDYDHATPTAIGIQLEIGTESESYTFETTVWLAVHRDKLE